MNSFSASLLRVSSVSNPFLQERGVVSTNPEGLGWGCHKLASCIRLSSETLAVLNAFWEVDLRMQPAKEGKTDCRELARDKLVRYDGRTRCFLCSAELHISRVQALRAAFGTVFRYFWAMRVFRDTPGLVTACRWRCAELQM